MLHKDFKDTMTPDEVIDLAYGEFSKYFDAADALTIKFGSDDGGQTLDFFIDGKNNGTFLRKEVPPNYNGFRTVIIFRDIDIDQE